MEKRLELERRGRDPSDIVDLNLDNCKAASIEGLTSDYCNLERLSMINVGLFNLVGLPEALKLTRLELSDNRLSDSFETLAEKTPALRSLNLSGNRIKDLASLDPLKKLSNLRSLDLFNCDVTQLESYREKLFEMLPQLTFLDGFDALDNEDNEVEEDEEENGVSDEDEEEESEEDDEPGLSYLQKSNLEDEDSEEDEDFELGDEEEEEEEITIDSDSETEDGAGGSGTTGAAVEGGSGEPAQENSRKRRHEGSDNEDGDEEEDEEEEAGDA